MTKPKPKPIGTILEVPDGTTVERPDGALHTVVGGSYVLDVPGVHHVAGEPVEAG